MQKLCISLHFLMYELCKGNLQTTDLSSALFYLGCTREHAIEPTADDLREAPLVAAHPDKHALVVQQLLAAERDGRVRWKALDARAEYSDLASFLSSCGLLVRRERLEEVAGRAYTHQGVRKLCRDLPLEVVAWKLPA